MFYEHFFFSRGHTEKECDCLNGGGLRQLDIALDFQCDSASSAEVCSDGGISLE